VEFALSEERSAPLWNLEIPDSVPRPLNGALRRVADRMQKCLSACIEICFLSSPDSRIPRSASAFWGAFLVRLSKRSPMYRSSSFGFLPKASSIHEGCFMPAAASPGQIGALNLAFSVAFLRFSKHRLGEPAMHSAVL
jgi:hypothetical protein